MAENPTAPFRFLMKGVQLALAMMIICVITVALYTGGLYSSITQGRGEVSSVHRPTLSSGSVESGHSRSGVNIFSELSIHQLLGDNVRFPGKSFSLGDTHIRWNEVFTRRSFSQVVSDYHMVLTKWGWRSASDGNQTNTGFVVYERRGLYLMIENVQPGMRFRDGIYHISLLDPGRAGLLKNLQVLDEVPEFHITSNDGVHAPIELSVHQLKTDVLGEWNDQGYIEVQGGSFQDEQGEVKIVESDKKLGLLFKNSEDNKTVTMDVLK